MISLNVIPFELESEMPLDEMIERLNMLEQNNLVGGACAKNTPCSPNCPTDDICWRDPCEVFCECNGLDSCPSMNSDVHCLRRRYFILRPDQPAHWQILQH